MPFENWQKKQELFPPWADCWERAGQGCYAHGSSNTTENGSKYPYVITVVYEYPPSYIDEASVNCFSFNSPKPLPHLMHLSKQILRVVTLYRDGEKENELSWSTWYEPFWKRLSLANPWVVYGKSNSPQDHFRQTVFLAHTPFMFLQVHRFYQIVLSLQRSLRWLRDPKNFGP